MTDSSFRAAIARSKPIKQRICFTPHLSLAEGITILCSALLLWFVLKDPASGAEAAKRGLDIAVRAALPSLFPFFVLSALLSSSGVGERLGKHFARPFRFLFGISGAGATAVFLGAFCGFPVGARIVAELYGRGAIGNREAERLLILSNSPSFAFLFSAVGAGYFGDKTFGIRLYLSVLLSTAIVGILFRVFCGKCDEMSDISREEKSVPHLSSVLAGSVSSAVQSALTVTGFIVFFTVLSSALSALLRSFGAGETVSTVLSGLLELTTGAKKAAETAYGLCGRVLCGFFAGFGGLCASLQVIATAERPLPDRARRKEISFRSYFFCKILIGALCALLVYFFSLI